MQLISDFNIEIKKGLTLSGMCGHVFFPILPPQPYREVHQAPRIHIEDFPALSSFLVFECCDSSALPPRLFHRGGLPKQPKNAISATFLNPLPCDPLYSTVRLVLSILDNVVGSGQVGSEDRSRVERQHLIEKAKRCRLLDTIGVGRGNCCQMEEDMDVFANVSASEDIYLRCGKRAFIEICV